MNDVLEVEHGFQCLSKAYKGPHGERLRKTLDSRFPGIVKEIEKQFDDSLNTLRYETFITCLSEHAGEGHEYEDQYGRGSMWRAYGRGKGVALVIKQDPFWTTSTALGAFTSPVAYLNDEGFADELAILANNLDAHSAYLDQIGRDWTRHSILQAFHFASVSTKHPGFSEEREWRVISSKALPFACPLTKTIECVAGIPQAVLQLELKNDHGMNNMTVPELLDRVIIGPTEYPYPVYDAFLTAMGEAEIPEHHKKLFVSHVPLRATAT
ncbi:MAG: DUF2971 domain-containing protein [Alphaproteobacteria bacterium]|nr:DUF2971 domain-containing protein [Alphaproteobacteria bacterium]